MAYWGQGTRADFGNWFSRPETRFPNNRVTRDVGMLKRQIISATFAGSTITDAATTFTGVWAVDDEIIVTGSALNNGTHTVLAVALHSLTVDFPVKAEGPIAGVEIRTP